MPLVQTRGAASAQGFGEFSQSGPVNYIEDMFSAFLWTGTGGQAGPFVTGVDLLNKGGLLWTKSRSNAYDHYLMDTVRGNGSILTTNNTAAAVSSPNCVNFYADGFKDNFSYGGGTTQVSWTFRKQPKFFDVVTYTGNGVLSYEVPHNLGSVPGCIIWKRTDSTSNWGVWHIASGITTSKTGGSLNSTNAFLYTFNATTYQTSTTFQPAWVNDSAGNNGNINGATYVAYLFAHNAGGFGLTGTDNVISCGSFTPSGGVATINLGYEPQWILSKVNSAGYYWRIVDNMRGIPVSPPGSNTAKVLYPNAADAEASSGDISPTGTGFTVDGQPDFQTIYIAIRRGPMKVPTTGTSVFAPLIIPINSASATVPINAGLTTDLVFGSHNSDESGGKYFASRLTADNRLNSTSTAAEAVGAYYWDNMVGVRQQETNAQPTWYFLKRAPSCFDEVCFTGTGSAITINHNLGVIPEIIITKKRIDNTGGGAAGWIVMSSAYSGGFISGGSTSFGQLQSTAAIGIGAGSFLQSTPTSTTIPLLGANYAATDAFVIYLFATCAGVSKVGSYTGTGATQTINCGFGASGSRFVLIKRTDSTGDWYVWDSARGMVSGTDPSLLLNSTAAEVNANSVYAISTGFQIVSTAAGINASGGSYIFLSVA